MKIFQGFAHNITQTKEADSDKWYLGAELILMLRQKKYEIIEGKMVAINLIETERVTASKEQLIELAIYLTKIVEEMEKFERVDQKENKVKHNKQK